MIDIHTDGSCIGNPGPGGWGVISDIFTICGHEPHTTNNIMEMRAVIEALKRCKRESLFNVRIHTDSMYVKNGITQWIHNWKRNGWKTSSGKDVKNKDLWIEIYALNQEMDSIEWIWVKAHNGNPKNEEVDKLARELATQ
jgi:ribonuclease HI|tara:strand:+ start:3406 stop:3825 length:420 start_codon:yes stop_codon:yes gene_type:complete